VRGRSIAAIAAAALYAACRNSETPRTLREIAEISLVDKKGLAINILREAKKKRAASGKDPMGLVAAALYIACLLNNEKKTQKDIAEAAAVTEVTVRNRYKALKRQLGLEPAPAITF